MADERHHVQRLTKDPAGSPSSKPTSETLKVEPDSKSSQKNADSYYQQFGAPSLLSLLDASQSLSNSSETSSTLAASRTLASLAASRSTSHDAHTSSTEANTGSRTNSGAHPPFSSAHPSQLVSFASNLDQWQQRMLLAQQQQYAMQLFMANVVLPPPQAMGSVSHLLPPHLQMAHLPMTSAASESQVMSVPAMGVPTPTQPATAVGKRSRASGGSTNSSRKASATQGRFVCPIENCGRAMKTKFSLKRHMQRHNDEKPFACDKCSRRFIESAALKRHQRVHTGERPFKCRWSGCNKSFTDVSNVKRHEFSHFGLKPFTCIHPDCSKTFTRRSSLKVHMVSVHHMNPNEPQFKAALKHCDMSGASDALNRFLPGDPRGEGQNDGASSTSQEHD